MAENNPKMPYAVPGVGECTICFEVVPFVKVLNCSHCLCLPCAKKVVEAAKDSQLSCPECRQPTDCSRGLSYLKTRYFGKIRCDICLEKKDVEDMWWCGQCFQALCSKCSIKEHSQKQHTMSEWNKMEPVQFSVNYLNQVQYKRQESTGTEINKKSVRCYLDAIETELHKQLSYQVELNELKMSLLSKYGTQFSTDPNTSSNRSESTEEGPRIVAKVLQLAGTEILETCIPSISDQMFQIYFTASPEEMAKFMRSKIEFIPFEKANEQSGSTASGGASAPISIEEKTISRTQNSKLPVLGMDYCPIENIVALRLVAQVQLYNISTNQNHSIPISIRQFNIRSMCLSPTKELLVALQSSQRPYEWAIEVFTTANFPISSVYSANLDIDPEDKVESMFLATGNNGNFYELRLCKNHVSEIWKVIPSAKNKKGKVKLKETLVYQRGDARYTDLKAVEGKDKDKYNYIFVWDELSSCLHRLIVKDGRCDLDTKVIHSVQPTPFCFDTNFNMWLYDPHLNNICVSNGTVINRNNVTFKQVHEFKKHGFFYLAMAQDFVVGVAVSGSEICIVNFLKL